MARSGGPMEGKIPLLYVAFPPKNMRKEEGTPVVRLWILMVKGETCLVWHTAYMHGFVWDSTWNRICGLKLSRPCLSCVHGCYDMSCYYVLFGCICFIQFHPVTSETVVTDDLCSHGLGWSSKILLRCHCVGGFGAFLKCAFG